MAAFPNVGYPLLVKNTFIDVEHTCDDSELDDTFGFGGLYKRQMTEPALKMDRQCSGSARSTLDSAKEAEEYPFVSFGSQQSSQDSDISDTAQWQRLVTGAPLGVESGENDFVPDFATHIKSSNRSGSSAWKNPTPAPPIIEEPQEPPPLTCVVGNRCGGASSGIPAEWENVHTAMMRNLPSNFSQKMLVEEMHWAGFDGFFDFLYLPVDRDTKASKGYAFINFIHSCYTWAFRMRYDGKRLPGSTSGKPVSITQAALQGLDANISHYSCSRVLRGDPDIRPLFFTADNVVAKRFLANGTASSGGVALDDGDGRDAAVSFEGEPSGMLATRRRRRRCSRRSLIDIALKKKNAVDSCSSSEKAQQQHLMQQQDETIANKVTQRQRRVDRHRQTEHRGKAAATVIEDAPYGVCDACGWKRGPGWNFCQYCGQSLMSQPFARF
eukprot:TRINITY_DN17355_c0_g1_i1.p1 TRINITY_DN17355_c0_g1~~TRINITY_DN17355_c0_g1_i1.p1  ORF type:complete len:440 (+),score=70.69 TRINITY_DN17355_c0_g1_i1:50-1369(+)